MSDESVVLQVSELEQEVYRLRKLIGCLLAVGIGDQIVIEMDMIEAQPPANIYRVIDNGATPQLVGYAVMRSYDEGITVG